MAKTSTQKASKSETKTETQTVAPVEVKETKSTKKGGSKKETKSETQETVQPVQTTQEVTPAAETKSTKKGGSKKVAQEATPATPATPATVESVAETKSSKKGGSKKSSQKEETPVAAPVAETKSSKKGGSKKAEEEPVEEQAQDEQGKVGHRFFRCVYRNTQGEIVNAGRYSGKKPKQAARKALTGIVKKNELQVGEKVVFLIQECTRGSKKKKYSYVGAQVELDEPVTVTIHKKDGQESKIVYTKDNEVKKVSLSECGDLVNVVMDGDDGEEVPQPVRVQRKPAKKSAKKATKKTSKGKKESTKEEVTEGTTTKEEVVKAKKETKAKEVKEEEVVAKEVKTETKQKVKTSKSKSS
jgi:hypothetical protein